MVQGVLKGMKINVKDDTFTALQSRLEIVTEPVSTGEEFTEAVRHLIGAHKQPPKSRLNLSNRVNGCRCSIAHQYRVYSMKTGENEEKAGRDGEIRTRDLLTPSQAR